MPEQPLSKPPRIHIRYRLYVRFYVALLASLLVACILFGMAAHGHVDSRASIDTLADVAAEMLPKADAPQAEQQAVLSRWNLRVRANLALYTPDGVLVAAAGRDLPKPNIAQHGSGFMLMHPSVFVLRLADGRFLLGQRAGHQTTMGMAALVALIALAVALGAYPVVRRLTRRLESLQASVDSLGAGQLGTRVDDSGKDEVAGLARSFNEAAARIEQLMQAQKTLLANASHELRSPLARIRMAAELMGEQGAPAIRDELNKNIAELDQLIEELLLASRLDAAAADTLARDELDLTALVAEECARVDAQLHAAPLTMHGDARLLRRLVRNLLENAKRYGGGSLVDVTLASKGELVELDVADHGPGVPEDQRELIFTPFYRLPGASEAAGGVGLGLSLVRQIARRHGGDVQCLSNEDGGCRFRVQLPLR